MKRFPLGPGDEDELIAHAKERLQLFPSTPVFDDRFRSRVRGFQMQHGLLADGLLDKQTVDKLGL